LNINGGKLGGVQVLALNLPPTQGFVHLKSGVSLHFYEWRPKEPEAIVLLHGLGCTGAFWSSVSRYLPTDYRLIAPDLRGHGLSSKPFQGYDFDSLSRDLNGLLDELIGRNRGPVVLVGHSWGANLSVHFALSFPSAVSRLVLVDGAVGELRGHWITKREYLKLSETSPETLESLPIFRRAMKRSLGFWNRDMEAMLDTTIEVDPSSGRVVPRTPDSVGKLILEELWDYDSAALLSRLPRMPVLLAIAQPKHKEKRYLRWLDDSIRLWNEKVSGLEMDVFPDTSHYIMVHRPRRLAKEINDFLARR
jgi:pimeloyl-ACP methyl ester carboxylesterase